MNYKDSNAERMLELAGAVCNQTASLDETAELNVIIREDLDLCQRYLQYCQIHIALRMELRADRAAESVCRQTQELSASPAAVPTLVVPEIVASSAPRYAVLGNIINGTIGFFSHEVPFSLLIATVITCLGLWAGSNIYVTHHQQLTGISPSSKATLSEPMDDRKVVGRITGMIDCKGHLKGLKNRDRGSEIAKNQQSLIVLGDMFTLNSGLVEITYNSGAKVILQAPVTYKVDSPDGGFLSDGKLTARLEKRGAKEVASGQWPVASESDAKSQNPEIPKSPIPNPQSLIPNPLLSPAPRPQSPAPTFAVRTPTATITDLGTEFGVCVQKNSAVEVQVFQGSVEVTRSGRNADGTPVVFPKQRITAGGAYYFAKDEVGKPLAPSLRTFFLRQLSTPDATRRLRLGLVAYWAFDDAANLGKNSMNGGDLDPVDSPEFCTEGILGGSLKLFGRTRNSIMLFRDGRGVPAGVPIGKSACSVSAWLRPDGLGESGRKMGILGWGDWKTMRANVYVIGQMSSNDYAQNYWVNNDERDVYAFVDKETFSQGWHHVVCTYDKGLCRIFVDGQWRGSRGSSIRPDFGANNFAIGRGWFLNSPGEVFDGSLDEIAIWNRELSDDDIHQLYNEGRGINPVPMTNRAPASQSGSVQQSKEETTMK